MCVEELRQRTLSPDQPESTDVESSRAVPRFSALVNRVLETVGRPCVSIDLEKDRQTARMIDRTTDFEDFRVLMRDQCGLNEGGSVLFIDEARECPVLARYVKSFCLRTRFC